MSLNETPKGERIHIGFFGQRNAGKSSLVNKITGQNLSVVSDVLGTTADPVTKAMELDNLGAVMLVDTAGIDDAGTLGEMRVEKTIKMIDKTDVAVLVTDGALTSADKELILKFKEKNIPYIVAHNKCELNFQKKALSDNEVYVSAKENINIDVLKSKLSEMGNGKLLRRIIGDFVKENDIILLVTPIDESAPKGRLILPQQQTIRDILDSDGICITVKETQLSEALKKVTPKLVITDSQVFSKVSEIVPENIPLTSFSILFARYKGNLWENVKGAKIIDSLCDGDTVLISEACTHHRKCEDIGTVKIPALIKKYTKKSVNFEFTSGGDFPEDLKKYKLIIHCGGCMITEREMKSRIEKAMAEKIPITNYGVAISYMNGILERATKIFNEF